ncbi:unnamed protein product [Bemisia tabaci]|uniref:Mitochondrial transcription rescue factor 1 C-terminal domain-containing protein n=1 Tax=Bemisia tabaci TaxID=7038 RepID=A0A9N9ZZU1_BEMTA|nr:unnamed protein product [Bemisia tabaci]
MLLRVELQRLSSCSLNLIRNNNLLGSSITHVTRLKAKSTLDCPLWRNLHCSPLSSSFGSASLCANFERQHRWLSTSHKCLKKKGSFKKYDNLNELDDEEEEKDETLLFSDKKHTKEFNATSTRLDGILKSGLGYSRKFVDQAFYESRVMVNGKKSLKKSDVVKLGDEVDIVHGYHPDSPKFLLVSRVELKAVEPIDEDNPEEGIRVKVFRHKNIKINNYTPPWKSSGGSGGDNQDFGNKLA